MSNTTEKKKILFTASTMSHIENFHLPYIEAFEKMGWEVKAVALPVSKSFFSFRNLQAVFSTKKMLLSEGFDVISSHSTLAGIVTRLGVFLTGKARKNMKIFHTAHGYLFHDDKRLKKWAYLLPEMLCGKTTDVLMVMNHEDLEIAKKYKLCGKSNKIHYIDGMGIDLSRFQTAEGKPLQGTKEQKEAFGIGENDFVFVYAAEFSRRKNQALLLKGFAEALTILKELKRSRNPIEVDSELRSEYSPGQLRLILAGNGALLDEAKTLARKLGIIDHVIFPGYIKDIPGLYSCCDAAVTTSKIEGLPFNVMEAMACGLPIVASDIKGHRELIEHGVNGLLSLSGDEKHLMEQLIELYKNTALRGSFSAVSLDKVKQFSIENVLPEVMKVYNTSI